MDSSILFQIILLLILIILSSFFSASETAMMSINKLKVIHKKEEGNKRAKALLNLIDEINKLLSAILIGNNIVNIAASSIATTIFITLFKEKAVVMSTIVMTILLLVFGEITPKIIAKNNPEKWALQVTKIMKMLLFTLRPIVYIFDKITSIILKILKIEITNSEPSITEDELKTIVNLSHKEGVLEKEEKTFINNVFKFTDTQAKEIMIQRVDIVAIDVLSSYNDIVTLFKNEKFTRVPVYEENIDNIIGILNVKDILLLNKSNDINSFNIHNYIRKPFFTYEFKKIVDIFIEMRSNKNQMAIVLDEYGGTSGLVTLENLIEEIVGDISDEYDEDDEKIIQLNENEFIIVGNTSILDVNEATNLELTSEEFDSIGGFLVGKFERIPSKGESLEFENIVFYIEEINKNRIEKIVLKILK